LGRMKSTKSDVCYFEVNAVFNGEPVERQRVDCCEFAMSMSVDLSVCLSASTCPNTHVRTSSNFLCMSPVALARASSGGVAICYICKSGFTDDVRPMFAHNDHE